jgi:uncharacterized protein (TIGR03000 family)
LFQEEAACAPFPPTLFTQKFAMKTMTRISLCLVLLLSLVRLSVTQEKALSTITILVPAAGHAETVVKANGQDIGGQGGTRTLKLSLPKDEDAVVKLEALIEPNNYTKITRFREIKLKGGASATVDMTVKNPKTDKIVVRWVPTPEDIVDEMCKIAQVGKEDTVYDLGCGDAVMLIRPIQQFGAKRGVGIDLDPKMLEKAKENVKKAKLEDKIELRIGDMLNVKDVSDANVVLLYIGDDLGERLGPVLRKTLKPGARVVSHRFLLGDWTPTKTVTVHGEDGAEYKLHLWVIGEKRGEAKRTAN